MKARTTHHRDHMKSLAWALLLAAFTALVVNLSSCTMGPDYTPDVTAHSASYGGIVPTFMPDGRMAAMSAAQGDGRRGTNIFD